MSKMVKCMIEAEGKQGSLSEENILLLNRTLQENLIIPISMCKF